MGLISKKRKFCKQNLTKERKQPRVVIPQKVIFYNVFIPCLWLRIIRTSDISVQFMNFSSQILLNDIASHGYRAVILKKNSLWLLPFFMVVATFCYYKKGAQNDAYSNSFVSISPTVNCHFNVFGKPLDVPFATLSMHNCCMASYLM